MTSGRSRSRNSQNCAARARMPLTFQVATFTGRHMVKLEPPQLPSKHHARHRPESLSHRLEEPRALAEVLRAGARLRARRPAGLRLPGILAEDRRQHLRAPRLAGPEQDP